MVNTQTSDATATTEVAEALTTPGVSDGSNGGMFVVDAFFQPSPLLGTFGVNPSPSGWWRTQIQTGDRSAGPAILEPTSPYYFANLNILFNVATSGAAIVTWPLPLHITRPEPVIVMDQFTVTHMGVNGAMYNSELVHVEILYRTCMLHDSVYNRALRNQSRLS